MVAVKRGMARGDGLPQAMPIAALPDVLLQHILLQLGARDVVRVGCTNEQWWRLSRARAEAALHERYGQSDTTCALRSLLVAEAVDDAVGPWPGPGIHPPTPSTAVMWLSEWKPMKREQLRLAGVASRIIDANENFGLFDADGLFGIEETLLEYAEMEEAMLRSGYSRTDAQTLVLLEHYFGAEIERAWRQRDKRFARSTHVLLDTLRRRAVRDVGVVAPDVYTTISRLNRERIPEEWAFLEDATEDHIGTQWLSRCKVCASLPDCENFPTGAGYCWTKTFNDDTPPRKVLEDSDVICIIGDKASGSGYR